MVPPAQQVGYLSRLLARDPGWAAHLKQRDPRLLADLLAIRATFDVFASAAAGAHVWAPAARVSDRDAAIAEVAPIVDLLYPADARQAVARADPVRVGSVDDLATSMGAALPQSPD